jgi:hypothetical protein
MVGGEWLLHAPHQKDAASCSCGGVEVENREETEGLDLDDDGGISASTGEAGVSSAGNPPHHFGWSLRQLRESYFERSYRQRDASMGASVLQEKVSISRVVACLKEKKVHLTAAALSAMETGQIFPKDGNAFIEAIAICLNLTPWQRDELKRRLAFDVLYVRFGEAVRTVLPEVVSGITDDITKDGPGD